MLSVACSADFPVGYALMRSWLEQSVRHTSIGIYVGTFVTVAVITSLIVIARVWSTVHANPATELRKE